LSCDRRRSRRPHCDNYSCWRNGFCVVFKGSVVEIKPKLEHMMDPYVLQLIRAIAERDDEIERLRGVEEVARGILRAATGTREEKAAFKALKQALKENDGEALIEPITGKYGEPRKYRVEDCPHESQEEHGDDYFCPDCGLRSDGADA
jgi:hypothetical protein